jgi:hypothetical protein
MDNIFGKTDGSSILSLFLPRPTALSILFQRRERTTWYSHIRYYKYDGVRIIFCTHHQTGACSLFVRIFLSYAILKYDVPAVVG